MVIGNVQLWEDTFPDHLVPNIIDLVSETWLRLKKPGPSELEVPITRRFKHALREEKNVRRLPFRIEREMSEDDLVTGEELGRIDLKFMPAESALEEVYFSFECKRLHALQKGRYRSLGSEYVTEGMLRYVTGQYAVKMLSGGMIGYVLDGECDRAIKTIEKSIKSNSARLQLMPPAKLATSSIRSTNPIVRETVHKLGGKRNFTLHHLFLSGAKPKATRTGSPRTKKKS